MYLEVHVCTILQYTHGLAAPRLRLDAIMMEVDVLASELARRPSSSLKPCETVDRSAPKLEKVDSSAVAGKAALRPALVKEISQSFHPEGGIESGKLRPTSETEVNDRSAPVIEKGITIGASPRVSLNQEIKVKSVTAEIKAGAAELKPVSRGGTFECA